MTEVFLAYAVEDIQFREKINKTLMRHGITTWVHQKDIKKGANFNASINEGIEQANTLLFFLSPQSVHSDFCKAELQHAIKYNKRIIPLLIEKVNDYEVPSEIKSLQYIDLTHATFNNNEELPPSFLVLLKELRENKQYYQNHKILLTQAIRWEKQNYNESLLLRGYNLQNAKTWLELGQSETYFPTKLHEKFIEESENKSALLNTEVFISYSRNDGDFARKLNTELQNHGKTTWFDQESISSAADFQQEIYRGIETSENFVFVISPQSIASPYCAGEVEYAVKLNKRIITLRYRKVEDQPLHPELSRLQWIDFFDTEFNKPFGELIRTLNTDREHVQKHTKISQRGLQWQVRDKNNDFLLKGTEFTEAENWLLEAEEAKKKPTPSELHRVYIAESKKSILANLAEEEAKATKMLTLEKEKVKKQRLSIVVSSAALVLSIVFGVLSFVAYNKSKNSFRDRYLSLIHI